MRIKWNLLILLVILAGCLKKKELPAEPKIVSYRFEIAPDSAVLYLDFTDGDGNFGLEDGDTSGIFAECIYRDYNLYAEYFEMRNGIWVYEPIDPCDGPFPDPSAPFYYKIPWVKPTGQNQTQEGRITIDMNDWYLDSQYDTIKFEVKMVDRLLNESNTITVGPYIKQ